MREIRKSGSEGGGAESNRLSLPLFRLFAQSLTRWYTREPKAHPLCLFGCHIASRCLFSNDG